MVHIIHKTPCYQIILGGNKHIHNVFFFQWCIAYSCCWRDIVLVTEYVVILQFSIYICPSQPNTSACKRSHTHCCLGQFMSCLVFFSPICPSCKPNPGPHWYARIVSCTNFPLANRAHYKQYFFLVKHAAHILFPFVTKCSLWTVFFIDQRCSTYISTCPICFSIPTCPICFCILLICVSSNRDHRVAQR